jgi:hypothetical protein
MAEHIQFNEIDIRCNGKGQFTGTLFGSVARIFGTIGL